MKICFIFVTLWAVAASTWAAPQDLILAGDWTPVTVLEHKIKPYDFKKTNVIEEAENEIDSIQDRVGQEFLPFYADEALAAPGNIKKSKNTNKQSFTTSGASYTRYSPEDIASIPIVQAIQKQVKPKRATTTTTIINHSPNPNPSNNYRQNNNINTVTNISPVNTVSTDNYVRTPSNPPRRKKQASYRNPTSSNLENNVKIVRQSKHVSQKQDKAYHFDFESENGIQRTEDGFIKNPESKNPAQVMSGSYSYTGPDGNVYTITYVADENGFRAEGAHLPIPPAGR